MNYDDLKDRHAGQSCFIIGKGPSLDRIAAIRSYLDTGVVFACNQAIHSVEALDIGSQLYCVQQDCELEYQCVPKKPSTIHLMNDYQYPGGDRSLGCMKVAESHYDPKAILYSHRMFNRTELSASVAVRIAAHMGIKSVIFFAFDSWDQPHAHAEAHLADYAECLGRSQVLENRDKGYPRHHSNGLVIRDWANRLMYSVKIARVKLCDEIAMEVLK